MNDIIKQDIIAVIHDSLDCLRDRNYIALKKLSNKTVHGASIFQEEDSVSIAVLIYSLSKVIERDSENKINTKEIIVYLKNALENLRLDKLEKYRKAIKKVFSIISKIDSQLKLYTERIIEQAEIKKGSKLYDHGISLSKAADMLGINQWELMGYIGKTNVSDTFYESNAKERYNFAKKLFGV